MAELEMKGKSERMLHFYIAESFDNLIFLDC